MSPSAHHLVEEAAFLIEDADALIVAAGAGMGVDSGLPDFRGAEGFWKAYPALAEAQVEFHRIASPAAFRADPMRAWGFYGHRLALYRQTVPHTGFALLRAWSGRKLHGGAVFTSNVDGQFQRAGFDADHIDECHGSIHHLQCSMPCSEDVWRADDFSPQVDERQCRLLNDAPHCPRCGALARPNIMMFGDFEWVEARAQAQDARLERWLSQITRPVVIEIGAGSAIPSVRHFSQRMIYTFGGRLVRINPREAEVPTRHDVGLAMGAVEALGQIAVLIDGQSESQNPNPVAKSAAPHASAI